MKVSAAGAIAITVPTGVTPGTHTLTLAVSDYEETKNATKRTRDTESGKD